MVVVRKVFNNAPHSERERDKNRNGNIASFFEPRLAVEEAA